MKIIVNGETTKTHAKNLDDLIAALGYTHAKVATAVNGEFVPATAREETRIVENDAIEIVAPRQGG